MNDSAGGNGRRVARAVAVMGALACTASLLLAHVHPFGDAGLYGARDAKTQLLATSSLPPDVRATLTEKCADCHSIESKAPIYGRLAPVSWLMERDILKGRQAMNLSLWDHYSAEQQESFKAKIVQETNLGDGRGLCLLNSAEERAYRLERIFTGKVVDRSGCTGSRQ